MSADNCRTCGQPKKLIGPRCECGEPSGPRSLGVAVGSAFLSNLHQMCAQTDGTYRFPNSREGDMLKTAKREIEQLRVALSRVKQQTKDYDRYSLPGVLHRIASEGLSPNTKDEPTRRTDP